MCHVFVRDSPEKANFSKHALRRHETNLYAKRDSVKGRQGQNQKSRRNNEIDEICGIPESQCDGKILSQVTQSADGLPSLGLCVVSRF